MPVLDTCRLERFVDGGKRKVLSLLSSLLAGKAGYLPSYLPVRCWLQPDLTDGTQVLWPNGYVHLVGWYIYIYFFLIDFLFLIFSLWFFLVSLSFFVYFFLFPLIRHAFAWMAENTAYMQENSCTWIISPGLGVNLWVKEKNENASTTTSLLPPPAPR